MPGPSHLKRLFAAALFALAPCAPLFSAAAADTIVKLDVPYVPTPPFVVTAMLELAEVGGNDVLYDLGSGDGRIVIAAVRDRGVRRAVGIDLNPVQVKDAEANARAEGVTDRATFVVGDIFKDDFAEATVVTMYLLPNVNLRLRPRLLNELKPGTRVVSQSFHMFDWPPDKIEKVGGELPIYLWIVPAKVQGTWTAQADADAISFTLDQKFQSFQGAIEVGTRKGSFVLGKLTGAQVNFEGKLKDSVPFKFEGKMEGDVLAGSLTVGRERRAMTLHR